MTKSERRGGALSVLPDNRLVRVLDALNLDRVVPHLAPETVHQLVRRFGMDVCAPLVGAATPEQIRSLVDLDLWCPAEAGGDDRFDGGRFVEWIELLADADVDIAARTLAAMDVAVAVTGLSEWVRVFDPVVFQPSAPSDDEPIELGNVRAGRLECEIGGYFIRARRREGWDALVAVLETLAAGHADHFHALMRGCRGLSNSTPEIDGLDDLLMAPAQQYYDVAVGRHDRRSGTGFLSAADARAFLDGARQRASLRDELARRWIATTYFRDLERAEPQALADGSVESPTEDVADALQAIAGLLADGASAPPLRTRALLENPGAAGVTLRAIRPLLAWLYEMHPAVYERRIQELAFLTNALMAGCSLEGRTFTPHEASDAAISTCNLGLERAGESLPLDFLAGHDLLSAFETGWALLHEDVSLFVADRLIAVLRNLEVADRPLRAGLDRLRLLLIAQRRVGTPWRVGDELDVLAPLDTPAWTALLGLFSECPVARAILPAIVRGGTRSVSSTAFEFVSTKAQVEMVRGFVERLPALFAS
jgi:hypothetical protein